MLPRWLSKIFIGRKLGYLYYKTYNFFARANDGVYELSFSNFTRQLVKALIIATKSVVIFITENIMCII